MLPETEKTWVLLPNNYRDVKNAAGETLYRIKECVDEFEYKFTESETGSLKKFRITEKRIVTFNPKLAKKQIYEINKEVEKARLLKASQAKNPSMVILQNMSFLLLQIKRATTQMVK